MNYTIRATKEALAPLWYKSMLPNHKPTGLGSIKNKNKYFFNSLLSTFYISFQNSDDIYVTNYKTPD